MNNRLFIIDNGGISSQYGVGTYIHELVDTLKTTDLEIVIVEIFSSHSSIEMVVKGNCTYLFLPDWSRKYRRGIEYEHQYLRNVAAYLAIHFKKESNYIPLFHLNFVEAFFVKMLKRYMNCVVIVTIHFLPWNFVYRGNEEKILRLWLAKCEPSNIEEEKIIKQIENFYESFVLCDKVICLTRRRRDFFLKLFDIKENKYIVIPNALHDDKLLIKSSVTNGLKKRLLQNHNIKIVLYVGRLEHDKNIASLIRCYKKTLQKYPHSHLIIAGSGNYESLLRVIDMEVIDKISFVGFLNKKELREIYSIADVGVMCSIHEEFGYVAVEMMINSIPLIISETSGIVEYLGDCCIKIPVMYEEYIIDEEFLTQSLLDFLTNDELCKEKVHVAKRVCKKYFDIDQYRIKMTALYKSLFCSS